MKTHNLNIHTLGLDNPEEKKSIMLNTNIDNYYTINWNSNDIPNNGEFNIVTNLYNGEGEKNI